MINVFKKKENLNKVVDKIYNESILDDIYEIDEYFSEIDINVKEELIKMYEVTDKKNTSVSMQLIKYHIQNLTYKYIGFKNESFYKILDNNLVIKKLEEDKDKYIYNFYNDLEEIEIMLIYTFKKYYQIISDLGKKQDLIELKAIYKTVMFCILNLLPESYRKEFENNAKYKELFEMNIDIKNISSRYIKGINYIIYDYLKEKHNVDLFDYDCDEPKRKKIIIK